MIRRRIAREELFRLIFESEVKGDTTEVVFEEYAKRNEAKRGMLAEARKELENKVNALIIKKVDIALAKEALKEDSQNEEMAESTILTKKFELEQMEKLAVKISAELELIVAKLKTLVAKLENQDELEELAKIQNLYPIAESIDNEFNKIKTLAEEISKKTIEDRLKGSANEILRNEIAELKVELDKNLDDLTVSNTRLFLTKSQMDFIKKYMLGITNTRFNVVNIINNNMSGWSFERIGTVEQTLLILSVYELIYEKEIPFEIAINEAVELAKIYGEEKTSEFINGVLAKVVKSENIA